MLLNGRGMGTAEEMELGNLAPAASKRGQNQQNQQNQQDNQDSQETRQRREADTHHQTRLEDTKLINLEKAVPKGLEGEIIAVKVILTNHDAGRLVAKETKGITFDGDPASGITTIRGPALVVKKLLSELQLVSNNGDVQHSVIVRLEAGGAEQHHVYHIRAGHDGGTDATPAVQQQGVSFFAQAQVRENHQDSSDVTAVILPDRGLVVGTEVPQKMESARILEAPSVASAGASAPAQQLLGTPAAVNPVPENAPTVASATVVAEPAPPVVETPAVTLVAEPLPLPVPAPVVVAAGGGAVNVAPGAVTDTNIAADTLVENAANGTLVGITASATDADGNAVIYSLSDTAGGRFAINSSTGVVTVANSSLLNFEAANSHIITVQASDGALSSSQNFTIALTNTNDAPTNIAISTGSVNENSAIGTVIGTLSAVDDDAGDAHTYTILSDPDNKFSLVGNTLKVNGLLNTELKAAHDVTIRVSDGTATYTKVLSIGVADVNETPVYPSQTFSLAENTTNGTAVGTAAAVDEDGGSLTYSITSGNTGNVFAINSSTGAVTVADNSTLNFETATSYTLSVSATDGTYTGNGFVTVNVTNVNEAPGTVSDTNATANSVAENIANGALVGVTASATDPEGSAVTYSLSDNAGGRFAINATSGVVTVANGSLLNYESASSHTITVQASDGTNNTTQNFTVSLTDANDAPVIANQTLSIAENSANSASVGTVTASDADAAQSLTYAITAGNTDGLFSINAANGQLSIANNANLNYELTPSRALTVSVTDNGAGTLSSSATVTVNLTDVNEAPVIANQAMNVFDTAVNGDTVGTVAATEPDAAQTLTYAITAGNGAGAFAINTASGLVTVADATQLGTATHNLTISATDNGAGTLSSSANLAITINEVNDAPVINNQTFNVNENSSNGSVVATAAASDPEGNALLYQIMAGNTDNIFAINSANGQITIANNTNLNYENATQYNLTVKVTEQGTPDVFNASATITIDINNLNETPVYADATYSLAENTANGASVGTATATDPDAAQTLTYSITAGNGAGVFAINAATGAITVADNTLLDYETQATSYALTVRATDNGAGALYDDAAVTVNLTNLNEAPVNTVPAGPIAVFEDGIKYITGISVVDVDSANPTVTLGVTNGTLTIRTDVVGGIVAGNVAGNGTSSIVISGAATSLINATLADALGLTYIPTANFSGAATLTVTTSDGALNDVDTVALNVSGVNDMPVVATPIPVQSIESDDTWSYSFAAGTFTDVEGDALTYSAQISADVGTTWTALPAWMTFNAATRTFDVAAPPGVGNIDSYQIKLTADDSNGGVTNHIFNFNVTGVGYTAPDANPFAVAATPGADVLAGGAGADTMYGDNGNDTMFGNGGNDIIAPDLQTGGTLSTGYNNGYVGNDLVYGGDGNDTIYGEMWTYISHATLGRDTLYGEGGNDLIYGGAGNDYIDGGNGNDNLKGGYQSDTLIGGVGMDTLDGGDGGLVDGSGDSLDGGDDNDMLYGRDGNDTLVGGNGADWIEGNLGLDTITTGAGIDTISYNNFEESKNTLVYDVITDFDEAFDKIRVGLFNNIVAGLGNASGRTLEWYQTGTGGTAKTIIRANPADYDFYIELTGHHTLTNANFIYYGVVGTAGADLLDSADGLGNGADVVLAGDGNDTIYSYYGDDQIFGGIGNDSIYASDGNDAIDGEAGNDWIEGGWGTDTIYGGDGDDTISDWRDYGTLYGDAGLDVFRVDSSANGTRDDTAASIVQDFTKGDDRIWFDQLPVSGFYLGNRDLTRPNEVYVRYDAGRDETVIGFNYLAWDVWPGIRLKGNYTTGGNTLTAADFIFTNVQDNDGNDLDAAANIIRGTAGNDGIIGTTGNDTIFAEGGKDNVHAGNGNDVIVFKDTYTNTAIGSSDHLSLDPGNGSDTVFAFGSAWDGYRLLMRSYTDQDSDTIVAGNNSSTSILRSDYYTSQPTVTDLTIGRYNIDYWQLGHGKDIAYGGRSNDSIWGGNANDTLYGGENNDSLNGEGNDDSILAGYGADSLYGSSGNDTFVFLDPLESRNATAERDVIYDFAAGDVVQLSGFTGIGAGATEVTINQYTATQYGYINGTFTDIVASNAGIDFKLTVKGTITFTAGVDLIFNPGTIGSNVADNMVGTVGADVLFGQLGNDTMDGGDGDDSVFGGHDLDSISGGIGNDSLSGAMGNDTLIGGAGADTMEGGSGADIFKFVATDSTGAGRDVIWDFRDGNDADKINLSDASFDAVASITFASLTIQNPVDLGSGYVTRITHADSGFTLDLVGYYEVGYNISATDFVF